MTPRMTSVIHAAQQEALGCCSTSTGGADGIRWDQWMFHGATPDTLDAPQWIAAGSVQGCRYTGAVFVTATERGAA